MSYLPVTDAGLKDWAQNFQQRAAAEPDPTAVGLTAEEVTEYTSVYEAYAIAYQAAVEPATRGVATILAKNEARAALIALSRKLAMAVTNHPGVTNQQRSAFGLTLRDEQRTPVPPPSTSPDIDFVSVVGRRVTVRLHDASVPGRRKPAGVVGATIFSYIGEVAPTDPAVWKFEGNTTRTVFSIDFPGTAPAGAKVWITAFWRNRKDQSGPGAPPVSTNLAYGGQADDAGGLKIAA